MTHTGIRSRMQGHSELRIATAQTATLSLAWRGGLGRRHAALGRREAGGARRSAPARGTQPAGVALRSAPRSGACSRGVRWVEGREGQNDGRRDLRARARTNARTCPLSHSPTKPRTHAPVDRWMGGHDKTTRKAGNVVWPMAVKPQVPVRPLSSASIKYGTCMVLDA